MMMGMGNGDVMMFRQLESLCCTSGCTAAVVGQSAITQLNQLPERQDLPELPTLSDLIDEIKLRRKTLLATQSFDICKSQMLKLSDLIEILAKYVVLALNLAHEW